MCGVRQLLNLQCTGNMVSSVMFSLLKLRFCCFKHGSSQFSGILLETNFFDSYQLSCEDAGCSSMFPIIICLDRCTKLENIILTTVWNFWSRRKSTAPRTICVSVCLADIFQGLLRVNRKLSWSPERIVKFWMVSSFATIEIPGAR